VRYIGTSTFGAWQLVESLWVAKEYGLNRFICEQPPYHILDRRIERELIPMAQTYGFGIIPWSPLAGGLLTGKYTRENPSPEGARYADVAKWMRLCHPDAWRRPFMKQILAHINIAGRQGAWIKRRCARCWNGWRAGMRVLMGQ
jgi:aryl-alcohol dehydrogenase-like predicted oxidoreductase